MGKGRSMCTVSFLLMACATHTTEVLFIIKRILGSLERKKMLGLDSLDVLLVEVCGCKANYEK